MYLPKLKTLTQAGGKLSSKLLKEYINYAKQNGILETMINTNATNLNEKMSNKLIDSGLDFLIYSFDGGSYYILQKFKEKKGQ